MDTRNIEEDVRNILMHLNVIFELRKITEPDYTEILSGLTKMMRNHDLLLIEFRFELDKF